MKPRNFVINLIIMLASITQIILTFVASQVPWWVFFVGLAGLLFVFPDWFLKPKHGIIYIVEKSIAIFLFIVATLGSGFVGSLLILVYEIAEDVAESCGGSTSFTQFDKFVAYYTVILTILFATKIGLLITDLVTFKKEKIKS